MYVDQLHAAVTSMALSNDGNCVLASCLDARLRLLDKASGELLAQYKGGHCSAESPLLQTSSHPSSACYYRKTAQGVTYCLRESFQFYFQWF